MDLANGASDKKSGKWDKPRGIATSCLHGAHPTSQARKAKEESGRVGLNGASDNFGQGSWLWQVDKPSLTTLTALYVVLSIGSQRQICYVTRLL